LWYINRLRDTHDLDHVLTGYGRDALGEASLLGFSHGQHGGMGISFIAFMGAREIAKHVPRTAKIPSVVKEGRHNGVRARPIVYEDVETLLREPLDAARERLGIPKPVKYKRALQVINEAGLEPALIAA
ncbi:MAG: Coq4 family protein, partial [Pseudomonadota bacterium]